MTTIPNPVTRVLELADPDEISQPAPPVEIRSWSEEIVPVTEPCERCGCYWMADPEAFLPEGRVECCYCRMWRGSLHRDASLSEYTASETEVSENTDTDASSETIEAKLSGNIPLYDPEAAGVGDETAVGVVEFVEAGDDA